MWYGILAGGLMAFALTGAAQAQSQVFLDYEEAVNLVIQQSAAPTPALTAELAKFDKLQADVIAKQNEFQRNQFVLTEPQKIRASRELDDMIQAAQKQQSSIKALIEEAEWAARRSAIDKVSIALDDYRQGNAKGVIVLKTATDKTVDNLVVTPAFEISTALAEMVKSGKGALAPAPPSRPPTFKYVDFDRFMRDSGLSIVMASETEEAWGRYRRAIKPLEDESDQLSQALGQRGLASDKELYQKQVRYLEIEEQKDVLKDSFSQQNLQLRERHLAMAREHIRGWARTNSAKVGADVIRLHGSMATDGGSIIVSDPALDLTAAAAAGVKATLN